MEKIRQQDLIIKSYLIGTQLEAPKCTLMPSQFVLGALDKCYTKSKLVLKLLGSTLKYILCSKMLLMSTSPKMPAQPPEQTNGRYPQTFVDTYLLYALAAKMSIARAWKSFVVDAATKNKISWIILLEKLANMLWNKQERFKGFFNWWIRYVQSST